jgi:CRISPR-associated protein Csb1
LIRARLTPLQGSRFQPTGFPDLGAARYRLHDGTEMLLVESNQSMANRMESVCWDDEAQDVVAPLKGLPYVQVYESDKPLTNSLMEAHRLNSVYIEKSDFRPALEAAIGYDKNADTPLDRPRLVNAICKYDPNALLHGVFLESIAGVLRIPRALSGFIEARNVHEVASGGVKNDSVRAGKGDNPDRTAKEGYGNVPYHRIEFSAEEVDAFFNLDIAQLRSYRLPAATTRLLYALAVYKIQAVLDRGLRLRTACDLQVTKNIEVTRPEGAKLPSEDEATAAIRKLLPAAAKEGIFANPPITRANFSANADKQKSETPEKPKRSKKGASK